MLKHSAARLVVVCVATLGSIVACSSPDTGGDSTSTTTQKSTSGSGANGNNGGAANNSGDNGGTSGGNTGGNTGGNNGGTASPEGGTSTGGDSACAMMATADACGMCCAGNHASGAKVLDDAYASCLCGASGVCQTQCAKSDCSMDPNAPAPTPGDACDKCEQTNAPGDGSGKCDKAADTACNADSDCTALTKCYESCPQM